MAKNKNKIEKELSDLKHCNEIKEIAEAALSAKKVIADAANEATKVIANSSLTAVNDYKREEKPQPVLQKVLYNQVSLIIASVGLAFSIYFLFANPQKQTDSILSGVKTELAIHEAVQEKSNTDLDSRLDLIQKGDIKDLQTNIMDAKTNIIILQNNITELKTIINERIPVAKK